MKAELMRTLSPSGGGRGRKDVKQRIKKCNEIKSKLQQGAYAHKLRYSKNEIDKVLPLPPPEGDKLLGNDNELSASDLMSVSE